MQEIKNFSLESDHIVQATAGAGKTTKLVEDVYLIYKHHLQKFGKKPKILLTTFTVKAANEIAERIMLNAKKKGDEDFLAYSVSYMLEIGTMHSVFSRLMNKIDTELNKDKLSYVSPSYKSFISEHYIAKSIEKHDLVASFTDRYLFKEFVDFFKVLSQENIKFNNSYTYQDLLMAVKDHLLVQSQILSFEIGIGSVQTFSDLEKVAKDLNDYVVNNNLNKEEQKKVKELVEFLKSVDQNESFINKFLSHQKNIEKVYHSWIKDFNKVVKDRDLFTLSDLEAQFLLKIKKKNVGKIWDYCFFDEYQDTNPVQKKIIDIIAKRSIRYFVGDPFQSIYYFRGARKEIFDDEVKRIRETTKSIEYKTINYRSSPQIVEFANELCFEIFEDFNPMTVHISDDFGEVCASFFEDEDSESEFRYILDKLRVLDPDESAILCRNTKTLLSCAQYLKRHGVTINTSFGKNFEESLEVLELVSFVRFIENQDENFDLMSLLRSDWFFTSDEEIKEALSSATKENVALWEVVKGNKNLLVLNEILESFCSYSGAIKDLLMKTDFLNKTDTLDDSGVREFNVFKFLRAIEEEELKTDFNVSAFCDDVLNGFYPFGKEIPEQSKGCQLMTVHGSKGLQFKNVFIIGCNSRYYDGDQTRAFFINEKENKLAFKYKDEITKENRFPYLIQEQIKNSKVVKMQENRRLLYVAVTRAENRLFIVGSGKREKKPTEPSWMTQVLKTLEKNPGLGKIVSEYDSFAFNKATDKNVGMFYLNNELLKSDLVDDNGRERELLEKKRQSNGQSDPEKLSRSIAIGVKFHSYMEGSLLQESVFSQGLGYLKSQKEFPFEEIYRVGYREWGYDWCPNKSIAIEGDEDNLQVTKKESGKIDLWAVLDDTVWVVDYKTGSAQGLEKGFLQLERYKNVLSDYLNNSKLKFKLVLTFPFEEKTWVKS